MHVNINVNTIDPSSPSHRIDEILKVARESNETVRQALVNSWLVSLDRIRRPEFDTQSRRVMGAHMGRLLRDYPMSDCVSERIEGLLLAARLTFEDGALKAAVSFGERALELARAHPLPEWHRRAANTAGILAAKRREFGLALQRFEEAYDIAYKQDDKQGCLQVQLNIAACLQDSGRYVRAMEAHRRTCSLIAGKDDSFSTLHALLARINLVFCAIALGDFLVALQTAEEVDALLPKVSLDPIAHHQFELAYVSALLRTGAVPTAQERVEQLRIRRGSSSPASTQVLFDVALALCEVHAGKADIGLTRLRRTAAQAAKHGGTFHEDALRALIQAYEKVGDHRQALEWVQRLTEHHRAAQLRHFERQHLALQQDLLSELDSDTSALVLLDSRAADLRVHAFRDELARRELDLLESWAVASALIDDDTGQHCYRVGCLSRALARELGFDQEQADIIEIAARLHDVGKVGIPHAVLLKPSRLSQSEWTLLQTHSTLGEELLVKSEHPAVQLAAKIARSHHEWWDGNGYPDKIVGDSIPVEARIVAVADAYDAMTAGRVYRRAMPHAEAIAELQFMAGRQFDPFVVRAFASLFATTEAIAGLEDESRRQAMRSGLVAIPKRIAAPL